MGHLFPTSNFATPQIAFVMLYDKIMREGVEQGNGTKAFLNFGFYIHNPLERTINVDWRKWNETYAEREWKWYLSKNRSVKELKQFAPIWDKMHNGNNLVNSNYGSLWSEQEQLTKVIRQLSQNLVTRQAWITFYDGKRKDSYAFDTPCTLNIGFKILNNELCMTVLMRSNDLWFGFCNDQYCFSKLQEDVASALKIKVGWYYHYAADLHIYEAQYNKQADFYKQLSLFENPDKII